MRTVTIKKNLYRFDELSEEAQRNAIERFRESNLDYSWWDHEDAISIGKLFGVNITNIYFSGFSSQGDGACFEGSFEYKKGALQAVKAYAGTDTRLHAIVADYCTAQRKALYGLHGTVKHSGHYYHENCTSFEVLADSTRYASDEQYDSIVEPLKDFMRWIYRQLESEYDHLQSDECIKETIESNEYEFDSEGVMQ